MIDHFVLGVADLEHGVRFFAAATGVKPAAGGRHPALGTHNALISLGPRQYLEILAPDPTQDGVVDALAVLPQLASPALIKWAAATDNADRARELLLDHGFRVDAVESGSRTRTDGRELHWRQAGFLASSGLETPFVIEWGKTSLHPGDDSPAGCTVASFTLRSPQAEALADLCAALETPLLIEDSAVAGMELVLDTPRGQVKLTS
jgi:hypothetical protein